MPKPPSPLLAYVINGWSLKKVKKLIRRLNYVKVWRIFLAHKIWHGSVTISGSFHLAISCCLVKENTSILLLTLTTITNNNITNHWHLHQKQSKACSVCREWRGAFLLLFCIIGSSLHLSCPTNWWPQDIPVLPLDNSYSQTQVVSGHCYST